MDAAKGAEAMVRASVDAFNRHDLDGCLAFLAPGGSWEVQGMGQVLSADEVGILFWQYFLREVHLDIRTIIASDACVAGEYVQTHTSDDGRRVSAPVVCVYEVADGLIQRVRQYFHPTWEREQRPAESPAEM